jgi:hypothetical protein
MYRREVDLSHVDLGHGDREAGRVHVGGHGPKPIRALRPAGLSRK